MHTIERQAITNGAITKAHYITTQSILIRTEYNILLFMHSLSMKT